MVICQPNNIDSIPTAEVDGNATQAKVQVLSEIGRKKIRIHLGAITRLIKEHKFYGRESANLLSKIDQMRRNGDCVHDIMQMSNVYSDSSKMSPQVLSQLRSTRDLLFNLLEEYASDVDVLDQSAGESDIQLILISRQRLEEVASILMDSPCAKVIVENGSDSSDY